MALRSEEDAQEVPQRWFFFFAGAEPPWLFGAVLHLEFMSIAGAGLAGVSVVGAALTNVVLSGARLDEVSAL